MRHLVVIEYISGRPLVVHDCSGPTEAQERLANAKRDRLAWHVYYKVRDASDGPARILASLYRTQMAEWSMLCG